MLRVRLVNENEVRRKHDTFIVDHEREVGEALDLSGHVARNHVANYPEFKPRTGALQRATNYRVIRTSGGKLLKITNTKDYAAAIDSGARPHTIVPVARYYLRFVVGGKTIFAQRVKHPGNRPYKFLYRAHNAADRFFRQEMTRRMSALAVRF